MKGDRAFYALFAAAALLALATFDDYGLSYDEAVHNLWYGGAVWRFFGSLGQDLDAVSDPGLAIYGGLFDALAEAVVRTGVLPAVDARHLANAAAGLLGVWGCRAAARIVGGGWAGFWAALLLLTAPPWYGHTFINAKDVPFAAGSIWTLSFLLRCIRDFPAVPLRARVGLAVSLGAAAGVRIGGVVLVGYALLFAVADLALWRLAGNGTRDTMARAGRWAALLAPVILLAYAVMIAAWPAALLHPLDIPAQALSAFSQFGAICVVVFQGAYHFSTKLPATYVPVVLAATLPEAFTLLAAGALGWAPWAARGAIVRGERVRALSLALLATASVFPLAWAVATRAPCFDNLRHFLFLLPPAAALTGVAVTALLGRLPRRAAAAAVVALALALGTQAARMAALHPYEYAFFSLFGGGMPGGAARFDSEYWLTSYREAAAGMVAHARAVAASRGTAFEQSRFSVLVTAHALPVRVATPPNFVVYGPDENGVLPNVPADYYLSTTRWGLDAQRADWPVVAEVARLGMRFAVVRARPGLAAPIPRR